MCARVAYCVDIDKSVIIGNFEKRGWVSVGPDDDWHFYWASTTTCRNLFAVDSGKLLLLLIKSFPKLTESVKIKQKVVITISDTLLCYGPCYKL
jgi:hypothetical protein